KNPVQTLAGDNPAFLVAARLSPSGNPGVVVVNRQLVLSTRAANTVSVLFPDPAVPGGFKTPVALPVGARNPQGAAVGDLDGDTFPDVVVAADGAGTLLLFTQQAPGGTFAAPAALEVGGEPTAAAIADLNGDGLPDIVATSGNVVSVLLQDSAHPGTYLPRVDYGVGPHPVAVAVADLDGDGRPDLAVANSGTSLAPTTQGVSVLLQGAQAGTFQAAVTYDTGDSYASSVAVGDLDGDGRPDLAVAEAGLPGYPGSVAVLTQDPAAAGAFKAAVRYGGVQGPGSVAIADIDGDGLKDLVIGDGALFVRFQITGRPGVFGPPAQFRQ
ncbi:MAG: VCBS repeat-containing protein, partial [Holophaga sp.]|nr:VCBS repeat-containing protein [Holophaga sp.]